MNKCIFLVSLFIFCLLFSCTEQEPKKLGIYGKKEIIGNDTILHTIPDFRLLDQDSNWITNETFANKIYIADFFFTSCPTICPRVKKQMLRIYEKYDHDELRFLSHSIDYHRDSIPVLKKFEEKMEINGRWHFVELNKNQIDTLAFEYMSIAYEDNDAPGGYNHSGYILLVDQDRHIRSFCDGTLPEEVDKFMKDIDILLNEKL